MSSTRAISPFAFRIAIYFCKKRKSPPKCCGIPLYIRNRVVAVFSLTFILAGLGYSQTLNGVFCTARTATPLQVKAEGVTELIGDLVVDCTQGYTTPQGFSVPTVNITVALNTQVTNRLLDSVNNTTDALLLLNEPGSPNSPLTQTLCPPVAANNFACNTAVVGTGYGGGQSVSPYPAQYANANIYQGILTALNQITFFNIPIDPPGQSFYSTGVGFVTPVLTLRITNVRANASALGAPNSSTPSIVSESISTSAGIPISGPVQPVGNVNSGLVGKIVTADAQISQCSVSAIQPAFTVSVEEGFTSSLQPRFPSTVSAASIPGNTGSATSGFLISGFPTTIASPGVADFGTRLKLTFAGTPPGVTLYVPLTINSGIFPPSSPTIPTLTAVLTTTETGPFSAVTAANGTNGLLGAVTNNEAVYEIVSELPSSLTTVETLNIPVSLSYSGAQGTYPSPGTGSVQVDFAASSVVITASTGLIPRYIQVSPNIATYTITPCPVTNFTPYSGGQQSAVINTSFGSPLQALLKDSTGNPVSSSPVTFTLPVFGPGALFAGGGNVATVYSNPQGIATSPQVIANSSAGAFTAIATAVSAGSVEASFTLSNLQGSNVITFAPISNHHVGDAPFALTASASASPAPISFTVLSGPATVSGSMLTINGAGVVTVQASQPPTQSYPAAAATQSFTASKGPFTGMACYGNTVTPLQAKAEGITEMVGDFVISCSGGTPTPADALVPLIDLTVTLNTQVTSRLLGGSPAITEALLIINDPSPGASPAQILCPALPANNFACATNVFGTGSGGGKGITPVQYGNANIYQGILSGTNQLTFHNVPVDPPGPTLLVGGSLFTPALTLRLTNVRANTSAFPTSTGFDTSIISASLSNSAGFLIDNPIQTVAPVFQGLVSRSVSGVAQFSQCSSQTLQPAFTASMTEGFATALQLQFATNLIAESIPGNYQNLTSGLLISGLPLTTSSPGVADFGTRVKLTFANTPPGVTLYTPITIDATPLLAGSPALIAQLTSTEAGPFLAVPASNATNGLLAAVTNNEVIYEVRSEQAISQNLIETLNFPVSLGFTGAPGSYPTAGTGTVQMDFAPSSVVTSANGGPVPRYLPGNVSLNTYTITPCVSPTVFIDAPAANATLYGTTTIGGWALENTSAVGPNAIGSITVFVDNNQIGTATYGTPRSDVCGAFPGRLGCPNVGWSYNLNVAALTTGSHTLKIVATDTANNSSFSTVTFTANPILPSVDIEIPIVNATLSGTVAIGGWAIENVSTAGPAAVGYVTVFVDNTQVGTATYGIGRLDVCGAFPSRLGCPNVGWSYNLNVAALTTGSHTLKIVATDTANNSSFSTVTFTANPILPSVDIETPIVNATLSGTVAIGGWAVENTSVIGPAPVNSVMVFVDNAQVGTATYGIGRPDVCAAFPGRPGCPNVGWSYNLNIAPLTTGSHTLKIVATDTANNSSFRTVGFTANPIVPTVVIESPVANATLSGRVALAGWAIENTGTIGPAAVNSVTVFVDNTQIGTANYGVARLDVCAAFPGRLGCPNVGWSYTLNVNALTAGGHTLKIVATDGAGNSSFNQVSFTANPQPQPSIYIDSPMPNATLSGSVVIDGWALENTGLVGPAAVSLISVYVDGTQVGIATYGISRPDVCGVFPGRLGCPNVGWSYTLSTSALTAGSHTLKIVAIDTTGDTTSTMIAFMK